MALVYELVRFSMGIGAANANAVAMALDDNLTNGRTYTLQFEDENWITSNVGKLQQDLVDNAPDFLGSLQVQPETYGLTKSFLNVQFTYEGDGSDVVSDVANAMIAAFESSRDTFRFMAAYSSSSTEAPTTPESQAVPGLTDVTTGAVKVITDTANAAAKGASDVTKTATNAAFMAALPWLIGAVLIVVVVLPVVSKSGLVPKVRVA